VLARYCQHHHRTDDWENGDTGYGETLAIPACRGPGCTQDTDELYDAERDVEEYGLEVCVSEVADYETAE
jgi:hypothetical protein